jgi:hypothetical protein
MQAAGATLPAASGIMQGVISAQGHGAPQGVPFPGQGIISLDQGMLPPPQVNWRQ